MQRIPVNASLEVMSGANKLVLQNDNLNDNLEASC